MSSYFRRRDYDDAGFERRMAFRREDPMDLVDDALESMWRTIRRLQARVDEQDTIIGELRRRLDAQRDSIKSVAEAADEAAEHLSGEIHALDDRMGAVEATLDPPSDGGLATDGEDQSECGSFEECEQGGDSDY